MKLFLVAFSLIASLPSQGLGPKEKRARAKDAIRAARLASNEATREKLYEGLDEGSLQDDEDVNAVYDELVSLHKNFKKDGAAQIRTRESKRLAGLLSKAQKPSQHAVVKQILDKEEADLPSNYVGPWGAKTHDQEAEETVRFERFQAVTKAAGEGKNESALPTLRKLRKKRGIAGQAAEEAIGRIGKDEDLDQFIKESKEDPNARIDLAPFGPKVLDRIMREVESPDVPAPIKRRLVGHIPRIADKSLIPRYVELSKSKNPDVAAVGARRLGEALTTDDSSAIQELLNNPNPSIRGSALDALSRSKKPDAAAMLIKVLCEDKDENQRAFAAHALSRHKGSAIVDALKQSSVSDSSKIVRGAASAALESIELAR